jgi:hypothetical protein
MMSDTIEIMTLLDLMLMTVVLGCMTVAIGALLFGVLSGGRK